MNLRSTTFSLALAFGAMSGMTAAGQEPKAIEPQVGKPASIQPVEPLGQPKKDGLPVDPKIKFAFPTEIRPATLDTTPQVHRMVIFNGAQRSTHYVGANLAPSDLASLRNLERAESELALAESLQGYRLDFLNNEAYNETQRRSFQQRILTMLTSYSQTQVVPGPAIPYTDFLPVGYLPAAYAGGWMGGYGYTNGYFPFAGAPWSIPTPNNLYVPPAETSVSSSVLVNLNQQESPLRNSIARALSNMATPEMAEKAESTYLTALSRVNQSDTLRTAMGSPAKSKGSITVVGIPDVDLGSPVTVTYKVDTKTETVEGNLLRDDPSYLIVRTAQGRLSVPKNQILNLLVKE